MPATKKSGAAITSTPAAKITFSLSSYKLVPKFGPLRVLQLKTPTPETEKMFEESFNASAAEYRRLLSAERHGTLQLPNLNFDVGQETVGESYRRDDDAHAQLLHKLAAKNFACVSPLSALNSWPSLPTPKLPTT